MPTKRCGRRASIRCGLRGRSDGLPKGCCRDPRWHDRRAPPDGWPVNGVGGGGDSRTDGRRGRTRGDARADGAYGADEAGGGHPTRRGEGVGRRTRGGSVPRPWIGRSVSVLRLSKVTREVGTFVILDSIDAAIAVGDRIGLVGPNGAGKT